MCQLSYISTLGQTNDKELRFKTQQCRSVKQIRKTYFTYCIMGLFWTTPGWLSLMRQGYRQTSETIDVLTSKLRYVVASLR